ncbi:MAG TPA: YceD family protein [Burkholderiales bacterium]|nr:YceD family protein [Burkholderiales bacterium]
MPEQLVINSLEFSRGAGVLRGKIKNGELQRLNDYLYSTDGEIEYELSGTVDPDGKSLLHLAITGKLYLKCQRCLEGLEHDLDLVSSLLLIDNEKAFPEITEENDGIDCIPAETEMDVFALLEEEIILRLPISPRHESGACSVISYAGGGTAQSVFAPLAALKRSTG